MNKFLDFINKTLKEENVSQDIQTVDTVVGKITKEKKPKSISFIDDEDELDAKELLKKLKEDFEPQVSGFIQRVMNPSTEKDTRISNPEELDQDFMYGYDEDFLEELFSLYQNFYLLPNEKLQSLTLELEDLFDFEDLDDSDILDTEDGVEFSALEELIYYCLLLLEEGYNSEDIFDLLDFEESDLHLSDEEVNYIFDEMYLVLDILDQEGFELEEAAGRFTSKNYNRKKRKFMKKSVQTLNREKTKRKITNRQNKTKRKQYYRANKAKIKRYNQAYRKAVKSGSHKVKIRKRA